MKRRNLPCLVIGLIGSIALAVLVGVVLQFAAEALIGVIALCTFLVLFLGILAS